MTSLAEMDEESDESVSDEAAAEESLDMPAMALLSEEAAASASEAAASEVAASASEAAASEVAASASEEAASEVAASASEEAASEVAASASEPEELPVEALETVPAGLVLPDGAVARAGLEAASVVAPCSLASEESASLAASADAPDAAASDAALASLEASDEETPEGLGKLCRRPAQPELPEPSLGKELKAGNLGNEPSPERPPAPADALGKLPRRPARPDGTVGVAASLESAEESVGVAASEPDEAASASLEAPASLEAAAEASEPASSDPLMLPIPAMELLESVGALEASEEEFSAAAEPMKPGLIPETDPPLPGATRGAPAWSFPKRPAKLAGIPSSARCDINC
jgi:hypothetical protein